MGTKGTWKRPAQVSEAEAQASWDRIFGPPPELVEHRSGWHDVARGIVGFEGRNLPVFGCTACGVRLDGPCADAAHVCGVQIAEPPATE